jgi:hypothetical protein
MDISKRILKVQAAVLADKIDGEPLKLGRKVGDAAEAAIIGGITSDAWKSYMSLFADSADQLKRLTTNELDATADDKIYLPRLRAYIVANGVCAPGTEAATMKNFAGIPVDIDADKPGGVPLDETVDPNVVGLRPFPV